MDTIIYLYQSREPARFVIEKWQEKEYCLIRFGVPSMLWQNLRNVETEQEDKAECMEEEQSQKEEQLKSFRHRFAKKKGGCERKKDSPNPIFALLNELQEMQTALCMLGENPHWTYCVYEGALQEKVNTALWPRYWNVPKFEEYHDYIWVEQLMECAVYNQYLILGYAPCLGRILFEHVEKMRSVTWYLYREQYTRSVQNFIEDFYEEYGLAIEVRLLEADEEWIRVRPSSAVPVNVLDFSGEEKIAACDVAKDSVWLDMDSLDGKYRRIENRNPGIHYFSLKKQWKQRQKEPMCLDTLNKNRYNT